MDLEEHWVYRRQDFMVAFNLPFAGDSAGQLRYRFGWGLTRWQGLTHCVDLLGIPLVGIWGCIGYFPSMYLRQFRGNQHVPRLSDLFVITCDYGLLHIDVVIIDCASNFWMEHRSTTDYPTCPGDDHEWSTIEFRE